MMLHPTTLPPKMAAQFADRARRMDGCVRVGNVAYEFAQGSTVICLIHLDPPIGHFGKDATRAEQIRRELSAETKEPNT
jgi:hypothetical protein